MYANIERWYSTEEITEYLGVSRDTVLNWIEKHIYILDNGVGMTKSIIEDC